MNTIHIAMITDNNYVIPTATAIYSLIKNKNKTTIYYIHIITSGVSEKNCNLLKSLCMENVHIKTIDPELNLDEIIYENKNKNILSASRAALFKFMTGIIFNDIDKILYIDSDTIIKDDLSCLFNIDLGGFPLAAVPDSGQIYYKHAVVKLVEKYFNSGVMLINCKIFREQELHKKLIIAKNETKDSLLMDQDAFNIVFDKNYLSLPIKYNLMKTNLNRAKEKLKIEQINELYNTNYKSFDEAYNDCIILHYASKDKPWKCNLGESGFSWHEAQNNLVFHNILNKNPSKLLAVSITTEDESLTVDSLISIVNSFEETTMFIFIANEPSENLWHIQNKITSANQQVHFLYFDSLQQSSVQNHIRNHLNLKDISFTNLDILFNQ